MANDDFLDELSALDGEEAGPAPPPSASQQQEHGGIGDRWVYGPPGTGKTSFLARQIEFDAQQRGSDAVVALSHTRAAAAEIALRRVPLPPENVGTLHSLAFRALGRPKMVETTECLREFGEAHPAFQMSETYSVDDMEALMPSKAHGDNSLSEYSRYRNLQVPREVWPTTLLNFAELWEDFKQQNGGIDFTDMIELALTDTVAPEAKPEVMIVDEGQDLSRLQFRLLTKWADSVDKFIMAFDPDQSIYGFAGADPTVFLETEPSAKKVLAQSHRVPRAVHTIAMRWIRQTRRADVEYLPMEREGEVDWLEHQWRRPESMLKMIEAELKRGKSIMVLTSCGYMLEPLIKLLRVEGFPFHNPYRRKQGAWNPMRKSRASVSTHTRVAAYLAPWSEGSTGMWTSEQLMCWTALLKGIFKRGGRDAMERALIGGADEGAVLNALIDNCADEATLVALIDGPPSGLDALGAHLKTDKVSAASFAIACARNFGGEVLQRDPQLCVGTIHSVKGGEADVVFLFPDISPEGYQRYNARSGGRDEVVRQFYVGMTRAKEKLVLLAPSGPSVDWGA